MFLNEEFLKLWEEIDTINEAKADTERLVAFAGEDLANRFLAVKNRLKAPENDLYYWINNKSVNELEQTVASVENTKSSTKTKKDVADAGAKLVQETEHWKAYRILTQQAAQIYGRDTHWCIAGLDGEEYWKKYIDNGVKFYVIITKQNYDPRGAESKFAFAVYPEGYIELFNQVDDLVDFDYIEYNEEIDIPGVDISKIIDDPWILHCENCSRPLLNDSHPQRVNDKLVCIKCYNKLK